MIADHGLHAVAVADVAKVAYFDVVLGIALKGLNFGAQGSLDYQLC